MRLSRGIWAGIGATLVILLASLYFFMLYKDPMVLVFGLRFVVGVWAVVLIVHILRHGIPVRVVGKE